MTRKSRRELERELNQLQGGFVGEIQVQSDIVTITEDMTDDRGQLTEEAVDVPDESDVLATESDAVTVWTEHMD
jgi:hypothetical protein